MAIRPRSCNVPAAPSARRRKRGRGVAGAAGLTATPASDLGLATGASVGLPFKMYVPRGRVGGTGSPDVVRTYSLRDNGDKLHRAYVDSIRRGLGGRLLRHRGHQMVDPPILANPSETRTIGGRNYQLYVEAGTCGWWRGSAPARSTGSTTRCSPRSPTSRCWRSRRARSRSS